MLIDRIQKKEKELIRDTTDDEVIQVVQTYKKQVGEQIADYEKAGNSVKVIELMTELQLVEKYLPEQLTAQEIEAFVKEIIANLNRLPVGKINKGMVMKEVMPHVKGKADNALVNQIVTRFVNQIQ